MYFLISLICFLNYNNDISSSDYPGLVYYSNCRPSITFVLGEDEEGDYYNLARIFYLSDNEERTGFLVDTCRSLVGLRRHLARALPDGAEGWGRINVVIHGNPWSGLSAPVAHDGGRMTTRSILEEVRREGLTPLPDHIVDSRTLIDVKACGLGQNQQLLDALSIALGGFDAEQPRVHSSPYFIHLDYNIHGQLRSQYYQPYFAFYKTAFRPPALHLVRDLERDYPEAQLEWLSAIQGKLDKEVDGIMTERFNIPITWHIDSDRVFKDEDFEAEEAKIAFIQRQQGLMDVLDTYDIPIEKFRWTITTKIKEHGTEILIKGKATVLCILQRV